MTSSSSTRFTGEQTRKPVSLGADEDNDVDSDAQHRLGSFFDSSKKRTVARMLTSTAAAGLARALLFEELLSADVAATLQLQCIFALATCFG